MPLSENCSTCKHSKQIGIHKEGNVVLAECRRFPPSWVLAPGPDGRTIQKVTAFPQVNDQMSCGEWHIAILTN